MSNIRKIGKNYVIQVYWQGKKRQFSLKVSDKKNAEKLQKQIDYEIAMGMIGLSTAQDQLTDLQAPFRKFVVFSSNK